MGSKTVYQELCSAVREEKKDGEDFATFAHRIGELITNLSETKYEKLSKPALEWFTTLADAIKDNTEFPALDGFPEEGAEAEAEEETSDEQQEETAKVEVQAEPKAAKKKVAGKTKPSATKPVKPVVTEIKSQSEVKPASKKEGKPVMATKKPAKATKSVKPAKVAKKVDGNGNGNGKAKVAKAKTESKASLIRELVVKKPDITFEDTVKRIGSTVKDRHAWNWWYNTQLVMRVVAEHAK